MQLSAVEAIEVAIIYTYLRMIKSAHMKFPTIAKRKRVRRQKCCRPCTLLSRLPQRQPEVPY